MWPRSEWCMCSLVQTEVLSASELRRRCAVYDPTEALPLLMENLIELELAEILAEAAKHPAVAACFPNGIEDQCQQY
eukprot:3038164-Rhodomonas_salina.1